MGKRTAANPSLPSPPSESSEASMRRRHGHADAANEHTVKEGVKRQVLLNGSTSDDDDSSEASSLSSSEWNSVEPSSPSSASSATQSNPGLRRSSSSSQLALREHGARSIQPRGRISVSVGSPVSGTSSAPTLALDRELEGADLVAHTKTRRQHKASIRLEVRKRSADKKKDKKMLKNRSPSRMESRLSLLFYLLRYPLLILILLVVLLDLIALSLVRLFVSIYESTVIWHGQQRKLWKTLRASRTFSEWRTNAERLDSFMKHDQWRLEDDTQQLYNAGLVRRSIRKLREARMKDSDPREVMKHLSHACKKNHAGSMNEGLFTNSYVGTKADVEDFFAEVETSIKYVTASKNVTSEEKSVFFKSVSRNFGRTALSLSGGGSITYYHMGVLKALFEQNLLPDVISGTSGGSLLAAIVCTRTDEELRQDKIFDPAVMAPQFTIMKDSWMARFQRLFSEGYLFDVNRGFENVGELTKGHMTFLEAYQKTGRVLCITVTPDEANTTTPSKVLNFMTAPDVIISSAVCASCALPWVLPSTRLLCKTESGEYVKWKGSGVRWRDGSIRSDVPDLSMLNVSFHIVSQVNPHITIFFYESQGSPGCPTPHRGGRGWRGGFLASSLIHMLDLDLKKWLRLCKDLRLLPAIGETDVSQVFLQQFEGSVTVLPASSNVLADCMYILRDPTKERLVDYIRHGELKTWPKLGMIGHKVRIEKLIKKGRQDSLPAAMKTAGMRRYSATDDHVITDFFEDL